MHASEKIRLAEKSVHLMGVATEKREKGNTVAADGRQKSFLSNQKITLM